MELIQKHYEKAILSLVLLGLAVAAAFLPMKVSQVRQDLETFKQNVATRAPKRLEPTNLTTNEVSLARVLKPAPLVLAGPPHNTLNPVPWMRLQANGPLVPRTHTGLDVLTVTNISPLYLRLRFDSVRQSGDSYAYIFYMAQEASTNAYQRRPSSTQLAVGSKRDPFTLKEIKGPRENPEAFILDVAGDPAPATVTKDRPYERVAGYAADLYYEPDRRPFPNQRVGSTLTMGGASYIVVAIDQNEVVVSEKKSGSTPGRRRTLRWHTTP